MIIGTKATLLPFDECHLSRVQSWVNDPGLRWGTGTEGPVSDFEHRRWYERLMSDRSQRAFIIGQGRGADAKPVGVIGLRGLDLRSRCAEYWIYIGEASARGKGIAADASKLILAFAFNTLGLNRIFLFVSANNQPAIQLYDKLGFTREGVCREAAFQDGQFVDRLLFSMLAKEYRDCVSPGRQAV